MNASSSSLLLHDDHWRIVVSPSEGGCLRRCEFNGEAVMQSVPHPERNGHSELCYFPMVPFANRIKDGCFQFGDRMIQLTKNIADSPHAIHGHGWQTEWQALEVRSNACSVEYRHDGDAGWPWKYRGWQTFSIAGDALMITLGIHNQSDETMPCGLGFHPYFPAAPGTRLTTHSNFMWDGAAHSFPWRQVPVPEHLRFFGGKHVTERQGLDHCFGGWSGHAAISQEHSPLRLTLTGCEATGQLIIYIPSESDHFCIEPVTHAINALNLEDPDRAGDWILEPETSREIRMTLRCLPSLSPRSPASV